MNRVGKDWEFRSSAVGKARGVDARSGVLLINKAGLKKLTVSGLLVQRLSKPFDEDGFVALRV